MKTTRTQISPECGHHCTTTGQARWKGQAFTIVELMIVMAILGLIAAIAVPQWEKYRNMARVRLCIANLRQVDHSKQHWAFEMQKGGNDIPTMNDLTPYFNQRITPECPSGGSYRLRRVSKQPTCTLYSSGHALSNLNMDDDPAVD